MAIKSSLILYFKKKPLIECLILSKLNLEDSGNGGNILHNTKRCLYTAHM